MVLDHGAVWPGICYSTIQLPQDAFYRVQAVQIDEEKSVQSCKVRQKSFAWAEAFVYKRTHFSMTYGLHADNQSPFIYLQSTVHKPHVL